MSLFNKFSFLSFTDFVRKKEPEALNRTEKTTRHNKSFLFSFCLSLFLLGCVQPNRFQNNQEINYSPTANLADYNNKALFNAGEIKMDKKFNFSGDGDWRGPNKFDLWLSVCGLTDRATRGTLIGQKFHIKSELGDDVVWVKEIENGNKKKFTVKLTNPVQVTSDNCLRWKQEVPVFDYFSKSVNLVIHYEIKSLFGNMGKIVRRVGINPWDIFRNRSQFSGIKDLTFFEKRDWPEGEWAIGKDNVISALNGTNSNSNSRLQMGILRIEAVQREEQPQQPTFKINSTLSLSSEENKRKTQEIEDAEARHRRNIDLRFKKETGVHMMLSMTAQPFVLLEDSTGIVNPQSYIRSGKFMAFANLIATGAGGDKRIFKISKNSSEIMGQVRGLVWSADGNGLQMRVPIVLKYRNTFGRVALALKIIPLGREFKNMKPFSAVYDLGEWDNWIRLQRPQFKEQGYNVMEGVNYEDFLASLDLIENENLATIQKAEQYIFGSFTPRFVRIMPGGNSHRQNTPIQSQKLYCQWNHWKTCQ